MNITFKNQLDISIQLNCGMKEYNLNPEQEVVLNIQDSDCMYVDTLNQNNTKDNKITTDSYCPICAENIGDEPFCSSCGDVSGAKVGEYSLHERDYYIQKQIRVFGKVEIEPVNYLKGE